MHNSLSFCLPITILTYYYWLTSHYWLTIQKNRLGKNRLYQVEYAESDTIYIGQCCRALKHRISEHPQAILNNTINADFTDDSLIHNNFLDIKNIILLYNIEKVKNSLIGTFKN